MKGPLARRVYVGFLLSLVAALVAYALHRAWILRTDYWDSFLYLNNARRMLGDPSARYTLDKPPLLPAMYIPVVAITRQYPASVLQLVLPHLWAVMLSFGAVGAVWLAFRRSLPPVLALLGAVLFMGNRVFVHYVAFSLTDLSSVGFVGLVFAAWLVAREQRGWLWFTVTGLLIGSAVATRYQIATLPFGIAAAELLIAARMRQLPDRRALGFIFAGFLGFGVWLIAHKWAFEAVGREFSFESLKGALEYAGAGALREYEREDPLQYFRMMPIAFSPLVLVLGAMGLVVAAVQRRDHDALFFVWLLFLGGGVFRVDHNEVRYIYPALPALIYFAMRTVEVVHGLIQPRLDALLGRHAAMPWVAAGFASAMTLLAVLPGLEQVARDQRPFFARDQYRAAAAWLLERSTPDARVAYHGRPLTTHPANPMQLEDDEFFNIFHFYGHILEYFMELHVEDADTSRAWVWSGRSGEDLLRRFPRTPILLVQGAPDDLHAWEIEVVDQPSGPIEVFASTPRVLRPVSGGLGDASGRVFRREGDRWISEIDARAFVSPLGTAFGDAVDLRDGEPVMLSFSDGAAETREVQLLEIERAEIGPGGTTR